jgi:hypothetical protein
LFEPLNCGYSQSSMDSPELNPHVRPSVWPPQECPVKGDPPSNEPVELGRHSPAGAWSEQVHASEWPASTVPDPHRRALPDSMTFAATYLPATTFAGDGR